MSRLILLGAVAMTAAVAAHAAGPATAITVLLLSGWLREHALRRGVETRLRQAVAEIEAAAGTAVVRLHEDQMRQILWETDDDTAPGRTLH